MSALPRTLNLRGENVQLRLLNAGDRDGILAFARSLPQEDLTFLRMDITDPEVVDRWIASVESGIRTTVVATIDGEIVGYGSLNRNELDWFRHLGEIRVIVGTSVRRLGLGGVLAHEIFNVAKSSGLRKVVAQMAREQVGAQRMFETIGFSAEALLSDWVIDPKDVTHDLLIMSFDVTGFSG